MQQPQTQIQSQPSFQQLQKQLDQAYCNYFKPNNKPQLNQISQISNNSNLLQNTCPFQQIDHAPTQMLNFYFSLQQNCLLINYDAFQRYYEFLFNRVKDNGLDVRKRLQAADMILVMNGENDRAWNLKKEYLDSQDEKAEKYLNVQWELGFNGAVCLKCKKSSSYYEYRLWLVEREIKAILKQESIKAKYIQAEHKENQAEETYDKTSKYNPSGLSNKMLSVVQRQQHLITRVLQRYFRNYFCWLYRNKLLNLITTLIKSTSQTILTLVLQHQLKAIHKFIQKYCNDYSGYSYLIGFLKKYYLRSQGKENSIEKKKELIERQRKWVGELTEYCEVIYQDKEKYRNLVVYEKWLANAIGQEDHQEKIQVLKNSQQ